MELGTEDAIKHISHFHVTSSSDAELAFWPRLPAGLFFAPISVRRTSYGMFPPMNYLVLTPKDHTEVVDDWSSLHIALTDAEFIKAPLAHADGFLVGEQFMELITFLGCMPYIETEEIPDKEFCYVRFDGPYQQSRLVAGNNTVRPRCPHCRGAIMDWSPIAQAWDNKQMSTACPRCGEHYDAATVNWKENASLGRCFIYAGGIHPSEAVPSERLLQTLAQVSGQEWKWFFVQNPV